MGNILTTWSVAGNLMYPGRKNIVPSSQDITKFGRNEERLEVPNYFILRAAPTKLK